MAMLTFPGQQVGDFTITAISDGYLNASLDFLSNIDPADASNMQRDAGQNEPEAVHINCYVVRGAGLPCSSMPGRAGSGNGAANSGRTWRWPVSSPPRSTPSC